MIAQSNISPERISVEPYHPVPGQVEVRLRDNIRQVAEGKVTLYEYDEYILYMSQREGLKEYIEANMADWLATGRILEGHAVFNSVK